jgi:hypothetical protein
LGCLLFVSVFGYLQFQFEFLEQYARISSLITAAVFFFFAYRSDHLGVLSLGITAFASFFGIAVTLNDLSSFNKLYNVGLGFSLFIGVLAIVLERLKIKGHFTFTYLNFSFLIFFCSALAGIFDSLRSSYLPYFLALLIGVTSSVYIANWKKSFMFLLYGAVAGYVGVTYWLADNSNWNIEAWLFYLIASCGGFIFFLVQYKNYFKRKV